MGPTLKQRWEAYRGPLTLLWIFTLCFVRTLLRCMVTGDVDHLVHPSRLRARAFAAGFAQARAGFREGDRCLGIPGIVAQARGVVVEVGAGIGNQVDHFDGERITHVYGIEPNRAMIDDLRTAVDAAGLAARYTIVPYAVDDAARLARAGVAAGQVDTVLAIQVLCSVPDPARVVAQLYRLLRPGGTLLVCEHLRCTDPWNRRVQRLYNPLWRLALDGCSLDRATDALLVRAGRWETVELEWDHQRPEASLFPRVWGRLVKAQDE